MFKLFGKGYPQKEPYYKIFLETRNLYYAFLDIKKKIENAEEFCNL
jgi:hypothetical protein